MEHVPSNSSLLASCVRYLDLVITDTSAMAMWCLAAVLQLTANLLLYQGEMSANATVQWIASIVWMFASLSHAWALRKLAARRPSALSNVRTRSGARRGAFCR